MKTQLHNAWALLIGVGKYTVDWLNIQPLSAPPKEVAKLKKWLLSNGVQDDHITTLLDKDANRQNILRKLQDLQLSLCDQEKMPELVIIYYAGHTLLEADLFDPKSLNSGKKRETIRYLAPSDTKYAYLQESAIRLQEFKHIVKNLHSKCVITFMDSCHSGGDETALGDSNIVTIPKNYWEDSLPAQQRVILSASYANQQAYQKNDDELHFTCRVLDALNGKAKCDENGQISVRNVYDYVYTNFRSVKKPQTPHIWESEKDISRDIILAIDRKKWLSNKFQEIVKQKEITLNNYLQERVLAALKDKGAETGKVIDALEILIVAFEKSPETLEASLESTQQALDQIDTDIISRLVEDPGLSKGFKNWILSAWQNKPSDKKDPDYPVFSAIQNYLQNKFDSRDGILKALEKRRNTHLQYLKRLVKENQLPPFTAPRWDKLIKCYLNNEKPPTDFEQSLLASIEPLCTNDISVEAFLNDIAPVIDRQIVYLSQDEENKFRPTWLSPLRSTIKWSLVSSNKNAIESARLCWMILFNEVKDSDIVATNDLLEVSIVSFKRSEKLSIAAYKEALEFLEEGEYSSAAEAFGTLYKQGAPDPRTLLSPPTKLIALQKVLRPKNKAVSEMLFPERITKKLFPEAYRLVAEYLTLLINQEKFQKLYRAAINGLNKNEINEKNIVNNKLSEQFNLAIRNFSDLASNECLPPEQLFSGNKIPQLKDTRLSSILSTLLTSGEYESVAGKLQEILLALEKSLQLEAISLRGYYHPNLLPLPDNKNPYEVLLSHGINFNSSQRQLKDLMALKKEDEKAAWELLRKVDKRLLQDWFHIPVKNSKVFATYARDAREKFTLPDRVALTRLLDKNDEQDYVIALLVLEGRSAACEFLEKFIRKSTKTFPLHQHSHTLGIIYFADALAGNIATEEVTISNLRLALGFMIFNLHDDTFWKKFRTNRQKVYESEITAANCNKAREEIYRLIRHWLLQRIENCTLSKLADVAAIYRQLYLELKAEYRCAVLLKRIGGLSLHGDENEIITGGYISLKHLGLKKEVRQLIALEQANESDPDATLNLSIRELRQLPLLFSAYAMLVIMMEESPESGLAIVRPILAKNKNSRFYHLLTLLAIEGLLDLASRVLKDVLPSNDKINTAINYWQTAYKMAANIDRKRIVRQQIINYAGERLQIFENTALKASKNGEVTYVIELTLNGIGYTDTLFRKLFESEDDRKVLKEYLVVPLADLYALQGYTRYTTTLRAYQKAAKDLRESIELNPLDYNNRIDFIHALMNAGDSLYFQRRGAEANVFYQEAANASAEGMRLFPHKERMQRYYEKAQDCLKNGPKMPFDDWLDETEK